MKILPSILLCCLLPTGCSSYIQVAILEGSRPIERLVIGTYTRDSIVEFSSWGGDDILSESFKVNVLSITPENYEMKIYDRAENDQNCSIELGKSYILIGAG